MLTRTNELTAFAFAYSGRRGVGHPVLAWQRSFYGSSFLSRARSYRPLPSPSSARRAYRNNSHLVTPTAALGLEAARTILVFDTDQGVHIMSSQRTQLRYAVFVAPEKPFKGPPPEVGDPPMWDPTTATLIYGDHYAVLVEALCTLREARALADWVELYERRLTTIYITHAHFDHWFGLPVLLERFPSARAVASAGTVRAMRRVTQVDTYRALLPNQLADRIMVPDSLDSDHFDLEGHMLRVVETGHTDTVDSTSLHVPDLGLVVAGDVVYNHCHMYVGDTTRDSRREWVAALDKLAALNPTTVVAGHKDPTRGDPPSIIGDSRGYIEAYGQLYDAGLRGRELFEAMVSRYPDWVSRQQFLLLGLAHRRADVSADRTAIR